MSRVVARCWVVRCCVHRAFPCYLTPSGWRDVAADAREFATPELARACKGPIGKVYRRGVRA